MKTNITDIHLKKNQKDIKFCRRGIIGNQGFITPDEFQAWFIGLPSDGSNLRIILVDFNNASYSPTELYNELFVGDGFIPEMAWDVDEDGNLYVLSGSSGSNSLIKFNRGTLSREWTVGIGNNNDGLVYVRPLEQLWVFTDFDDDYRAYDKDGNFIEEHSDQIEMNTESTPIWNTHSQRVEWMTGNTSGRDYHMFDPVSKSVVIQVDVIPTPIFSATWMSSGAGIDYDGNRYFIWESTDNNFRMVKYDPDWNELWQTPIRFGPTTAMDIDPQGDIYYAHGSSTDMRLAKMETDENGLNPSEVWSVQIADSLGNSVNIQGVQAERAPTGRVFTVHSVQGGMRSVNKLDGSDLITMVSTSRVAGMIVLPGLPYSVP